MEHELKTDPQPFDDMAAGLKTFELRKDDRGFQVGDTLRLRRTVFDSVDMAADPWRFKLAYCDDAPLVRIVTHILRGPAYGLAEGWVAMSVAPGVASPDD
jgi:hypothetical protein